MDVEDTEAIAARTAELVAGAVRDEAWPFVAAAVHVAVTVSGLGQHFVSSTALLADSLLAYLVQAPCSAETWAPSQPLSAVERILGEDSEDDAPASAAVMTLGRLVVLIERKTGRGLGDGPMAQLAEAVIRARSFWRHQSPRIVRACGVMLFGSAETDIKDVSALVERDPSLIRLVLDLISDERSTNELRRRAFAVCERLDLVACSSLSRIAIAHVNAERRGSIDGELVSKSLFGTVARALTTGDKRAKQTDKAGMVKIMQMLGQVDPRLFVIDSVPMPTWSDRLYPALVVHDETWSAVVIEMSNGLTQLSKVATLTDDSHLLWTVFQVAWTVLPAQPYKKIAQCLSGGYLEAIVRTMLAGDAVASSGASAVFSAANRLSYRCPSPHNPTCALGLGSRGQLRRRSGADPASPRLRRDPCPAGHRRLAGAGRRSS